jgi:lysyl endopeptidase
MKRNFLIITILVIYCNTIYSQIQIKRIPYSIRNKIEITDIQKIILPDINLSVLEAEDIIDEQNDIPPRFGFSHIVEYNLTNSGKWNQLSNGDRIWFLQIICPGAKSINLLYDKFWLPEGAEFFIYNNDKRKRIGMFSSKNNRSSREIPKGFATGLVFSDTIFLEYFEPKQVIGSGIISISRIVHGYRKIGTEDFGDSGDCQVNVNCTPEGNNWQNEKSSVAVILVNGDRICTGSLINNMDSDGNPLFLTADHCLWPDDAISNPDLSYWSFLWNYESQDCNDGTDFTPPSTSGATALANNTETDFALLQLDENPLDISDDIYFNGWNRNANQPVNGVGIHHPSCDIKKIATHNITPDTSNCMNFYFHNHFIPNNAFWKINWQATTNGYSVTEGGSSGSPLYNSNHRVIGQLFGAGYCNNPNCGNPTNDIANYGRIFSSWNRDATEPRRRLRDWLDPSNSITDLPGLRLIQNTTINSNSIVSGDIVIFENITIQNGSNIDIDFNERFETRGSFNVPLGATLYVGP